MRRQAIEAMVRACRLRTEAAPLLADLEASFGRAPLGARRTIGARCDAVYRGYLIGRYMALVMEAYDLEQRAFALAYSAGFDTGVRFGEWGDGR